MRAMSFLIDGDSIVMKFTAAALLVLIPVAALAQQQPPPNNGQAQAQAFKNIINEKTGEGTRTLGQFSAQILADADQITALQAENAELRKKLAEHEKPPEKPGAPQVGHP